MGRHIAAILLPLLAVTLILIPLLPSYAASEMLVNGGFESGLSSWQTYGGTLAQVTSPIRSGSYAVAFSSATVSTKWLYQDVTVVPGHAYTFSGWAVKNDFNVSSVYLRISFRSVIGGTHNELLTVDSAALTSNNLAYLSLTVSGTAPSQATLARVMALLVPASSSPAVAYFDDLSFSDLSATPSLLHVRAWSKGSNPALTVGLPGAWDEHGVAGACVIKDGISYKMWYTGRSSSGGLGTMAIGYATSADGINWNKAPAENPTGNPVLIRGSADSFDARGVAFACVIKDGASYKMWYTGYSGFAASTVSKIGYATSADGINWTKQGVVLDVGASGTWESMGVGAPCVIKDGVSYKMWYTGVKSNLVPGIGYATSSDGINWTKYADNPTLSGVVGAPSVIKDSGIYRMWYTTYDSQGIYQIGYASSSDGLSWAKASSPELRAELSWEGSGVGSACVIKDDGSYKMWYAGLDSSAIARIGRAFPGPYTSIQSAIDAAATSDTIVVHPGTYAEQLTVNKPNLTIKSVDIATVPMIDATGYNPAVTISASGVTFKGFHLSGAVDRGIRITSGVTEAVVIYNDILGSPLYGAGVFQGLVNESSNPMVVHFNWWGNASGPGGIGEGSGSAVRGRVTYAPWLTGDLLTLVQAKLVYKGVAKSLGAGWNIVSTPFALDSSADNWGEVVALGNGLNRHPTSPAYYFDAFAQQWKQVTSEYQLKPAGAIYVRMAEPDQILLLASPQVPIVSWKVYSGWNLVSLSIDPSVYPPWEWVDVAIKNSVPYYAYVVSPPLNQIGWVYIAGDALDKSSPQNPGSLWWGEGYWVYNAKSDQVEVIVGSVPLASPIPASW